MPRCYLYTSPALLLGASLVWASACSASPPGATTQGTGQSQGAPAPKLAADSGVGAAAKQEGMATERPRDPNSGPAGAPAGDFVGDDDLVARESLKFASLGSAKAYDKLEACFVRYGSDWTAYPRRRFGNFINVEWCRGKGSQSNCSGGDTRTTPGAGWTELEVLQFERDRPMVFGLSFSTGQIPKQEGVAVSFAWSEGGRSVLGDHMSATFQAVQEGKIVSRLTLGVSGGFPLGEDTFESEARGTAAEVYERLRASPDSLRKEALAQLDGVKATVEAALAADTPRKCVFGEYEGDGIPPQCIKKVSLDASEKAAARAELEKVQAPQRQLVAEHAEAMHAGLLELMPNSCWSPVPADSAAKP